MKRLVVLSGLLFGGVAHADAGDYVLFGCTAEKVCVEIQTGNIDEFEPEVPCQVNRTCIPEDPGGGVRWGAKAPKKASPVNIISSTTGIAASVVKAGIGGLTSAAKGAGYDHFEARLSGPDSSITFSMDMNTGHWGINSGDGSGGPDHKKNIP